MKEWLQNQWINLRTCKIDNYFNKLDASMQEVIDKCEKIEQQLNEEVKSLTEEVAAYKGMLHSMTETLPDMMWCKDLEGKYIYANQAIIDGLLLNRHPIGKNDVELALLAKARYGDENHTFGEKCFNSDKIVLDKVLNGVFNKDDGRFLESGKVKGEMIYLEVFKAPWIVNGIVRGVVGTGRVMTTYVKAYREQGCGGRGKMADIFKKYKYGED